MDKFSMKLEVLCVRSRHVSKAAFNLDMDGGAMEEAKGLKTSLFFEI